MPLDMIERWLATVIWPCKDTAVVAGSPKSERGNPQQLSIHRHMQPSSDPYSARRDETAWQKHPHGLQAGGDSETVNVGNLAIPRHDAWCKFGM